MKEPQIGKVAIVGACPVGVATASRLAAKGIAGEVVLVDSTPGLAEEAARGIAVACTVRGNPSRVRGSDGLDDVTGAYAVVVAACGTEFLGSAPAMPMSLDKRWNVKAVARRIRAASPTAFVVVATDRAPLVAQIVQSANFEPYRVMGVGEVASACFKSEIGAATGVSPLQVTAMVLNGVPLVSSAKIDKMPLADWIGDPGMLQGIVKRTVEASATPHRFADATGSAAAFMVQALTCTEPRIVMCAVKSAGQYGIEKGTYAVLPTRISRKGARATRPSLSLSRAEHSLVVAAGREAAQAARQSDCR